MPEEANYVHSERVWDVLSRTMTISCVYRSPSALHGSMIECTFWTCHEPLEVALRGHGGSNPRACASYHGSIHFRTAGQMQANPLDAERDPVERVSQNEPRPARRWWAIRACASQPQHACEHTMMNRECAALRATQNHASICVSQT